MSKNTLSTMIKEARELKGISQRELARQINVDNSSIAKIEKGLRSQPSVLTLRKVANILDLDEIKVLEAAGYEEEDIKFSLGLAEKNIVEYFEKAPLSDISKMIERLELEIKYSNVKRSSMVHYDVNLIKSNKELSKSERSLIVDNWDKEVQDLNLKIEEYTNTVNKLKSIINLRQSNGEKIDDLLSDDISAVMERYIKHINSKYN